MFIIRRLFVFVLQFATVTALVTGACVAYTLRKHGMAYSDTHAFEADIHLYIKYGLAAAVVFCLILFCYYTTRTALRAPSDPGEDGWRF